MKTFAKRAALVTGLLCTALLCLGVVYIDTVQNFWSVSGGFVRLTVSNTFSAITISTNLPNGFGFNTNNAARSFYVVGRKPPDTVTGNGITAATSGSIQFDGANGGDASTNGLLASGGVGGAAVILGGVGGSAANTVSNSTGGAGGSFAVAAGSGGGERSVATNAITGGTGGAMTFSSGPGGAPAFAATNTAGGAGGALTFNAGSGATPSAGWARKAGNGGALNLNAGSGGSPSDRTNGASGGAANLTAGNAGSVGTATGDAGVAGNVNIKGGNGANGSGGTNSNGGHVYLIGGTPGTGAAAGDVIVGRDLSGLVRGGFMVGISNSATLTNVMFVRTNLDFPSTLAQTDTDIPVLTVAGRTNAIVNVGPPPSALLSGVVWSGFCSNGVVFVRCSVYGALAKDPNSGDFEISVSAYR